MNADELVDFLLQDDDFTVEVRYETPDSPFQTEGPLRGIGTGSKKLGRNARPVFTEVDEILKDLEQLIVRPGSCQTYNALKGDSWTNTEQEATGIDKEEEPRRQNRKKTDRKQQAEMPGAIGDDKRKENKQKNTIASKSGKSRKSKLKKDRSQTETESSLIPQAGSSSKIPRKNEHKKLTSEKEHVDKKKHPKEGTKDNSHQHEDLSKKRSKKKKSRQEVVLSEEVLIKEVTELLEVERAKIERDATNKVNAENRTRKSVSRLQAPLGESKDHRSKKLSKKRKTSQKNAEKVSSDSSKQLKAEDSKEDRMQQVVMQQKLSDSKE